MLSLYESHTRTLLFRGDLDECKAAGLKVSMKNRMLRFRGEEWRIVNYNFSRPGDECLWITKL